MYYLRIINHLCRAEKRIVNITLRYLTASYQNNKNLLQRHTLHNTLCSQYIFMTRIFINVMQLLIKSFCISDQQRVVLSFFPETKFFIRTMDLVARKSVRQNVNNTIMIIIIVDDKYTV